MCSKAEQCHAMVGFSGGMHRADWRAPSARAADTADPTSRSGAPVMTLYPGTPYEYSRALGDVVFTAGACPLDEHGEVVGLGDLAVQAARAVDNLLAALAIDGATAADLLKATIYVASAERHDLVDVWDVVAPRLGRAPSTLLGVAVLGYEGQLVEIEAVARRPQPVRS